MRSLLPVVLFAACIGGGEPTVPTAPKAPTEPSWTRSLALCESPFSLDGAKATPGAATLHLLRGVDGKIQQTTLKDPDSTVFHKAISFEGGLLTIAGDGAKVVHWVKTSTEWTPTTLWAPTFGGTTDRVRDLEVADLDGDGVMELIVATHDRGVVAVGTKGEDEWTWVELSRSDNTFVHEIEVGDVDGDGVPEIYATPSLPNMSSGHIQPGKIVRFVRAPEGWVQEVVADWADSHAKEILVADLGSGVELLALREGRTGPGARLVEPAAVLRLVRGKDGWTEQTIAALPGERQARFLVPGDVDQDGQVELIVTGFKTGVWLLDRPDKSADYAASLIDGSSRGFEQAAHVADLDGDGKTEIYVVSEPPPPAARTLHRYTWSGRGFDRKALFTLHGFGLVWCVQSVDH